MRKSEDHLRCVRTLYNGRKWLNELEGKGPYRGSFDTKAAALAVGRAHAADGGRAHLVEDEQGNVLETLSYAD